MALFKILKGNENGLPATKTPGYMYITEDEGNIFVDLSTSKRIQLNALNAKKAATSDKWTEPITLSLSGDVTGSVSIDGSAGVEIEATVQDNSHNHTIDNVVGLQSALDDKNPIYVDWVTQEIVENWTNSTLFLSFVKKIEGTFNYSFEELHEAFLNNKTIYFQVPQCGYKRKDYILCNTFTDTKITAYDLYTSNTGPDEIFISYYITIDSNNTATFYAYNIIPVPYPLSSNPRGTYGPSENITGNHEVSVNIPQITVDAYGRVTSVTNRTYTSVNTDTNDDSKVQTTRKTSGTGYVTTCTGPGIAGLNFHRSVYVNHDTGVLMGAAWNDYAEYREIKTEIEPGRVVIETGNGDLVLSQERMAPAPNVVSDTFGFAIGQTEKCNTPIAIAGRALVYPFEDRENFKAGDAVCAGPKGTVSLMTREEIKEYPDRILGIVSEIPNYETWGETDIKVNNRIWIKIR